MPTKREVTPPKPWILGTGGARNAEKAIKGRHKRLQDAENRALGIKKKRK